MLTFFVFSRLSSSKFSAISQGDFFGFRQCENVDFISKNWGIYSGGKGFVAPGNRRIRQIIFQTSIFCGFHVKKGRRFAEGQISRVTRVWFGVIWKKWSGWNGLMCPKNRTSVGNDGNDSYITGDVPYIYIYIHIYIIIHIYIYNYTYSYT